MKRVSLDLGDMRLFGDYPPKMLKALAVISDSLHSSYDALNVARKGYSKELCLFASLAARDFLVAVGYADATVRPCTVIIDGERDGKPIKSLGIGVPRDPDQPFKFNGHAVVHVPSIGMILDTTLYQAQRERWDGAVPGMMVVPVMDDLIMFEGQEAFAGIEAKDKASDSMLRIVWLDRRDINFRREDDFTNPQSRERRRRVASALRERFGTFEEVS